MKRLIVQKLYNVWTSDIYEVPEINDKIINEIVNEYSDYNIIDTEIIEYVNELGPCEVLDENGNVLYSNL